MATLEQSKQVLASADDCFYALPIVFSNLKMSFAPSSQTPISSIGSTFHDP